MNRNHSKNELLIKAVAYLKQRILRLLYPPFLVYAPNGWKTVFPEDKPLGWNAKSVVSAATDNWYSFCNAINGPNPLGFSQEHTDLRLNRVVSFHNEHITYGYVLALAAHQKSSLSILDYGGGLGHYYQIGKALLPNVKFYFCCKEVPIMAEAGKLLNPEIRWFTDDSCLKNRCDLVMINGSLQYLEKWQEFLRDISAAVGEYLLLTCVPVIEKSNSFVAVQKVYGRQMLHWQFNKDALLKAVKETGLSLVREFVVGDRPYIKNAPEQCELRSWLFRKTK